MRSESATMPPQLPVDGPKPNAASVRPGLSALIVEHLADSPRRHSRHVPQETAHGTTTTSPTSRSVTDAPVAVTWAMHSCPIPKGPWNGTGPTIEATTGSIRPALNPACIGRETGRWIGSTSPSHRLATNGRTNASVGSDRDGDRKSTRLNSSHVAISYAVFCLKKKKQITIYI